MRQAQGHSNKAQVAINRLFFVDVYDRFHFDTTIPLTLRQNCSQRKEVDPNSKHRLKRSMSIRHVSILRTTPVPSRSVMKYAFMLQPKFGDQEPSTAAFGAGIQLQTSLDIYIIHVSWYKPKFIRVYPPR